MDIETIINDIMSDNGGYTGESVVNQFIKAINKQQIIGCLISKINTRGHEKIIWMNLRDLISDLNSCLGLITRKLLGILSGMLQGEFDFSTPLYRQLSELESIGHLIIYIDRKLEEGIKGSLKNNKKHKKKRKYKNKLSKKKRKYKNKLSKKKNKYRSKRS